MYDKDLMRGRVAFVTGAAGGIGRAVCEALAAHGARVVAADLGPGAAAQPHQAVEWCQLDVTQAAEVRASLDEVVGRLGRLDILVNVAGVVSLGNAEHLAEAEWDRVIDINLKGSFLCCQAAIPHMRAGSYGRIVNLGSVVGKNGGNPRPWLDAAEQEKAGNVAYGVSKAGVHMMTAFLAKELAGSGITVNAVAPGPVSSAMTTSFPQVLRDLVPVGRMGTAQEVAAAILFLAAPQSGFVTGEVLDVNGGIWCD